MFDDTEHDIEIVSSTYFHTGNSGTTIEAAIVDDHPALIITATTFGNLTHKSLLFVDAVHLAKLGDRLTDAAHEMIGLDLENQVTAAVDVEEVKNEYKAGSEEDKPKPPLSSWRDILGRIHRKH